jgi:O-antigen ligase
MTASPASAAAPAYPEPVPVRRLRLAGEACLVLLPVAMWLANRSAPLLLGLAAAAYLAAVLAAGEGRTLAERLRALLGTPPALALGCFLFWALLSIGWSHDRPGSLRAYGELVLPLGFALLIAASGRFRPSPGFWRALALALILAGAMMVVELASGLSQRAALGTGKLMGFVFNRPMIVLMVLVLPTVQALWSRPGAALADRGLAVICAAVVTFCVFRSESEAAKLGLAVAWACWLGAVLLPRLSRIAVATAFVATMAIAPAIGPLADKALPKAVVTSFDEMSSRARIDIWQSFGEVATARPVTGTGFGSAATMQNNRVVAEVSHEHRAMLAAGHPHDTPLQSWVETGLVGATLLTVAGLLALRGLVGLPARDLAPRLALFAGAFSVATVGHGAWQGWWIAALALAVLLFTHGIRPGPERDGDG